MSFWKPSFAVGLHHLIIALIVALAVGCQPIGPDSFDCPPPPRNALSAGDTLLISYRGPGAPEDFTVKIGEDGNISVPPNEIGPIKAQGKTIIQLQEEIQTAINLYYKQLLISVSDIRFFYISGEINRPGKLQYQENLTLLAAIAAGGDFTNFANENNIQLIREGKTYTINAAKAKLHPESDCRIYPKDNIIVKRRIF
ncbi:MAG: polysaccharide export protein [Verrucomicrobia bacterium]|nr:polysaccharide export protein [Verrucomicrobiota bacterium]